MLVPKFFANSRVITAVRQFSFTANLCKMSKYTTVEKGAPNSTDFRIFYSECIF